MISGPIFSIRRSCKIFCPDSILFFYLQDGFWQKAINVVESVWQLVCLVHQLEAVNILWPFWYLKVHKIRDVFMNNHNINNSIFSDMFWPFGVGKSVMKSCTCPFLGSKSVIIIELYTDKMGCLSFFFVTPNFGKVERYGALELSHRIWNQIQMWNPICKGCNLFQIVKSSVNFFQP